MKIKWYERISILIAGLSMLIIAVGLSFCYLNIFKTELLELWVYSKLYLNNIFIVIALQLFFLLIFWLSIRVVFRTSTDKGFIVYSAENGDIKISLKALANITRKCAEKHPSLIVNKIKIKRHKLKVAIDLNVTLKSEEVIPDIVGALQKEIKEHIQDSTGVHVQKVRVSVETLGKSTVKGSKVSNIDHVSDKEVLNNLEEEIVEVSPVVDTLVKNEDSVLENELEPSIEEKESPDEISEFNYSSSENSFNSDLETEEDKEEKTHE